MRIYVDLSLYAGIHFLQFLNGWSCSAIPIFKCFKFEQSPLIKDINLLYKDRICSRNKEQHLL